MDLRILSFLLIASAFTLIQAQSQGRNLQLLISSCYQNSTAYNRWTRQPMHIDNFIAIVRKIEEKTNFEWDNRRLARTLLYQFQYEGLSYDGDKVYGFEYDQKSEEAVHTNIVRDITAVGTETIPENILSNDEQCALHWMLSHSINATMRDDEVVQNAWQLRQRREARDVEQWGTFASSKSERATNYVETQVPLETGVVQTKWGAVATAKVLAGIVSGLEPQQMYVQVVQGGYNNNGMVPVNIPSTGRNPSFDGSAYPTPPSTQKMYNNGWVQRRQKRQTGGSLPALWNYFAATLAGDVGQAAILNAVWKTPNNYPPPTGEFNDTICPREYVMSALQNSDHDVSHEHDTWSYMTTAEIRGGVDGLVLGTRMKEWERYNYRLSDFLAMYYSEKGIVGEPSYRACNRVSLFNGRINPTELLEQSKSFAYIYNNRTRKSSVSDGDYSQSADGLQRLYDLVQQAYTKMQGAISTFSSTDAACVERESSDMQMSDSEKSVRPRLTLYAVLDHSASAEDLVQQQRFVAQLAWEIGVSKTGSRLGLVNGATGAILIKPNSTDNPASLACDILSQRVFTQTQVGVVSALRTVYSEVERLKNEEERQDYADRNGIVVLVLNQGNLFDEGLRSDVRSAVVDYRDNLGDVHVIYASSRYQTSDYEQLALNRDYDIIKINNAANLSTEAGRFTSELVKKTHGRITYPRCNKDRYNQDREHEIPEVLFVSPNTIEYYQISADYFYSAKNLKLRITSENGKARVCMSRSTRYPNSGNEDTSDTKEKNKDVVCKETTGSANPDAGYVEFSYEKPCNKGKRPDCSPIYVSVTPTSVNFAAGAVGLDCEELGCEYPDQVKVNINHWDMRCNGALQHVLSLPGFFITAVVSILALVKYS